jgi:hypothetical protein
VSRSAFAASKGAKPEKKRDKDHHFDLAKTIQPE